MSQVELVIADVAAAIECRSLSGNERLGEPARFELTAFTLATLSAAEVLGKACAIRVTTEHGQRVIDGIVTQLVSIGTSHVEKGRRYRLTVESQLAQLRLRRRTRIFQHLGVPEILAKIAGEAGFAADRVQVQVSEPLPPREYVVQYFESDLSFMRRLCEEEGLYFRFDRRDDAELLVIEDTSRTAPRLIEEPLVLVDENELTPQALAAWACRSSRKRRPGKVTLRDYNVERPGLALEAVVSAGTDTERDVEIYEAPGRFAEPAGGKLRATRRLESARVDGETIWFQTNAVTLSPGTAFAIECATDYAGTARRDGKHFVVALRHSWSFDEARYAIEAEAIPLDVAFRLPRDTPRPRIAGLQSAIVTGAPGEEIHPDRLGRIHVRFHWDREGSLDHRSSLPVRVGQPNTPGSMVTPRVGWEVFVAFEDGDPDRPYVLGRVYNGKQPPPFSLPANKTITSLATFSSPGAKTRNSIHFDDGAGRQHLAIFAGFGKATTVASNLVTQVASVETCHVKGTQTRTIGASEDVSVKQAYFVSVGSQSASVGGPQKIYVKGDMGVTVGSETVLVGGALVELVGNPASGAANLASSAALAGVASLGRAGQLFAAAVPLAKAGIEGYKHGGAAGAAKGVGMGILGMAAGAVPGGDSVLSTITGAGSPAPWKDSPKGPSDVAAGGGAGAAASDASGAKGPGPGHRNTQVKGGAMELIGGLHGIMSPGSIGWQTTGASTFLVSASHSTKTASATFKTLGGSKETLGSLRIKSGGILSRSVTGALNTNIGGSLTSTAGGKHVITAKGALNFKVGGSLTMDGSHIVFMCGSSVVAASPGGVLIKADTITITGASKQSGKATHP